MVDDYFRGFWDGETYSCPIIRVLVLVWKGPRTIEEMSVNNHSRGQVRPLKLILSPSFPNPAFSDSPYSVYIKFRGQVPEYLSKNNDVSGVFITAVCAMNNLTR